MKIDEASINHNAMRLIKDEVCLEYDIDINADDGKICDWYRTPKGDKRTTPTAEEIDWMKKIAEAYLGRGGRMNNIKVESKRICGCGITSKVFLNGEELHDVTSVKYKIGVNEIPSVVIEFQGNIETEYVEE